MPVTDEKQPDAISLPEPATPPAPQVEPHDETPHEPCQGFAIGE
jgi:hypothetical protein